MVAEPSQGREFMVRKPKKPTGTMGSLHLSSHGGATYTPIAWPETKDHIENHVLRAALESAKLAAVELYDLVREPVRNEEQHFDFTLHTRTGVEYLDLMEIAPLRKMGGSFANAPGAYVVGDMTDAVWEEMRK
jgi:DNA-binding sugar fermentation-stimulating protein